MKTSNMKIAIAGLAAVAIIAVGANAMAGKGMGYQADEQGGGGYGGQHRRGDCAYGQMNADVTPEQREQLDAERQAFFEATKNERQDLHAKRLALRAEMAKRQPDVKKASGLQREITELRGSLDQKRLDHIMAMRKISPDAGRGCMMEGRGMGHHGKRHGMGYGTGNCPNQ
jgi:Spy/CpxP family protein refolding chaperone